MVSCCVLFGLFLSALVNPYTRTEPWSGYRWKDVFLLQNFSISDAKSGQIKVMTSDVNTCFGGLWPAQAAMGQRYTKGVAVNVLSNYKQYRPGRKYTKYTHFKVSKVPPGVGVYKNRFSVYLYENVIKKINQQERERRKRGGAFVFSTPLKEK